MREKKWTVCPVCGARDSMKKKGAQSIRRVARGYSPVEIEDLDGHFCEQCGDGFWSLKSERKITRVLAKHMAEEDASRVVAGELASVPEAAEILQVSRQAVHKMMNEGRIRYVQTPSLRLPIRADLKPERDKVLAAHGRRAPSRGAPISR